MSRFYVPKDSVSDTEIRVGADEARHILTVLRLREGDAVRVFDGTGMEYLGRIKRAAKKDLIIGITEKRRSEKLPGPRIRLVQAIPKKDKMDHIVEKATELGVHAIAPVFTERTIPRFDDRAALARLRRWVRIAEEASKQCGRSEIPTIEQPRRFQDSLEEIGAHDRVLIATLTDDARNVKETLSQTRPERIVACVGPEGDFTKEEVMFAKSRGAAPVSLGPLVLKSDTAALVLLTMIGYHLGNR